MTKSHLKPNQPHRRIIYMLAPFLFLVSCLTGINLLSWWTQQQTDAVISSEETAVVSPAGGENSNQTINEPAAQSDTPTATTPPTPSPTPYRPPQYGPETTIQLLGPPPDTIFSGNQAPIFYWKWSQSLSEDQYFAIVLLIENDEQLLGTLNEPNLGSQFQWQLSLNDIPGHSDSFQWQIRLHSVHDEAPLLISEVRALSIR